MASLYLLNKFYNYLTPNTFVPAITNSEIFLSIIIKFYIEYILLKYELYYYIILLLLVSLYENFLLILPFALILCYQIIIISVPAYRTYKSIINNNIKIFNFNK